MESPNALYHIPIIWEVRVGRLRWYIGMDFHMLIFDTNVVARQAVSVN